MIRENGQILIPVILLVLVLAIIMPSIISWTQNESHSSVRDLQSTRAEEMAEAGLDLGFQTLIQSSSTWNGILAGTIPNGFHFDVTYSDLALGTYAVKITAGPGAQQATVVAIGKDKTGGTVRGLKAIYQNSVSQTALYAANGITLQNNVNVEWGPITCLGLLTTDAAHTFPRLYGNNGITPFDSNGAVIPNTDNVQWWSYSTALPPVPQVDVTSYSKTAQALGGLFYDNGLPSASYNLALPILPGTYYFDNDTTLLAGTGALQADLIVDGNLTINFASGIGGASPTLPPTAWQEYGNAWSHYRAMDPGAPATFPGISGTYTPGVVTIPLTNVGVHGFIYVKKQLTINGVPLGNINFIGAMFLGDVSNLNSTNPSFNLYFDPSVASSIRTINVTLNRLSWQNLSTCSWTTTPSCP